MVAGDRVNEKRCDAKRCGATARWRVFLYVPAVKQPKPNPLHFPA